MKKQITERTTREAFLNNTIQKVQRKLLIVAGELEVLLVEWNAECTLTLKIVKKSSESDLMLGGTVLFTGTTNDLYCFLRGYLKGLAGLKGESDD